MRFTSKIKKQDNVLEGEMCDIYSRKLYIDPIESKGSK